MRCARVAEQRERPLTRFHSMASRAAVTWSAPVSDRGGTGPAFAEPGRPTCSSYAPVIDGQTSHGVGGVVSSGCPSKSRWDRYLWGVLLASTWRGLVGGRSYPSPGRDPSRQQAWAPTPARPSRAGREPSLPSCARLGSVPTRGPDCARVHESDAAVPRHRAPLVQRRNQLLRLLWRAPIGAPPRLRRDLDRAPASPQPLVPQAAILQSVRPRTATPAAGAQRRRRIRRECMAIFRFTHIDLGTWL